MKKWIGLWMLVCCLVSCSDDDEKADTIELSVAMLNYESEGGEQGVLIQSSAEWKVTSEASWCFVQDNKEAGQFSVIVSENEDFNPRMAILKLAAGNCVKEMDILQKGKVGNLSLSANKASVYDLNDNYAVVLHSEKAWTATTFGNWFTIEPASGEAGTYLVRIRFSENKVPAERKGSISFESADSETCLFEFTQGGALEDSRKQDSLALLSIYDAIGGDQLKTAGYLKNWKEGSLENWDSDMMRDGRVVKLTLRGNIGKNCFIPEDVKYLSHLEEFLASSTFVGGNLPDGFGRCKSLKTIRVSHFFEDTYGFLTGELPKSWCALKNLEDIDLYGNKLTGSLPLEYANLSSLVFFTVSRNEMSGSLPAVWSNLSKISGLKLASNNFTGEVPEEWAVWPYITEVDFSKNSGLFGKLPIQFLTTAQSNGGSVNLNGTNIIMQ